MSELSARMSAEFSARHEAKGASQRDAMLPDERPMDMPVQELWDHRGAPRWASQLGLSTWVCTLLARLLLVGLTVGATALFAIGLYHVLKPSQPFTQLIALTVSSTVCFAWVAFGSAMSIVGVLSHAFRGTADTLPLPSGYFPLSSRNALLFPVYHEDPREIRATIAAIGEDLKARGQADAFDVFVLSDTRGEDHRQREVDVFARSGRRVGGFNVYYRNRTDNAGKKAGNIADWVMHFGDGYDHFIILDADSIMSGETLVRLAGAMEKHPKAGLIQTLPRLVGSQTLFARLQQFAHGVYGPMIASGYAAWQGASGNYWGHNAIIRTRAFARSAGLPKLSGQPPFGGPIQSHDFVEAAMLRRDGWGVHMVPSADGSYERCPPTLMDMAVRDRRWAQGNLQHTQVLSAHGLPLISRIHMGIGIFAYLASALWCLTLLMGLWLTAFTQGRVPQYFPSQTETLFPEWPTYDPQAALYLLVATAFVVLVPKLIGIAAEVRYSFVRGENRWADIVTGGAYEIVISMLLAPVMMLTQIRAVVEILLGRDSGWSAQSRVGDVPSLGELLRFHWWHIGLGLLLAWASFSLSWHVAAWMSPIFVGLILSPVLSWWTARPACRVAKMVLATREDLEPPRIVVRVKDISSF